VVGDLPMLSPPTSSRRTDPSLLSPDLTPSTIERSDQMCRLGTSVRHVQRRHPISNPMLAQFVTEKTFSQWSLHRTAGGRMGRFPPSLCSAELVSALSYSARVPLITSP